MSSCYVRIIFAFRSRDFNSLEKTVDERFSLLDAVPLVVFWFSFLRVILFMLKICNSSGIRHCLVILVEISNKIVVESNSLFYGSNFPICICRDIYSRIVHIFCLKLRRPLKFAYVSLGRIVK